MNTKPKSRKKAVIIAVLIAVLIGGFLLVRAAMEQVLYDPIEKNELGSNILTYRMSVAKTSHKELNEALKKYYPLVLKDGLYLENISRGSFQNSSRTIDTEKKTTVTVIKAGRGIYTYPYNEPFLKMHAEQSTEQDFEKDKQTIVNYLDGLVKKKNSRMSDVVKENYKNIEYYSVDSRALRTGSVIGITHIFFPKEQMVATIYFFNQNEGKESYETLDEYKALKTKFIQGIIDSAT